MFKQGSSGSGPTGRAARRRGTPSARSKSAPAKLDVGEVPPQVRAPNRPEWPGPINEEERAALKAGWSFVE